jgi:hypothetical protein
MLRYIKANRKRITVLAAEACLVIYMLLSMANVVKASESYTPFDGQYVEAEGIYSEDALLSDDSGLCEGLAELLTALESINETNQLFQLWGLGLAAVQVALLLVLVGAVIWGR